MQARDGEGATSDGRVEEAAHHLAALVRAVERYRMTVSSTIGLGTTESQAIGLLLTHGSRGQNELAQDLGLSSSAGTALVDRLVLHGVGERTPHVSDRRRSVVRLTPRGEWMAGRSREPLLDTIGSIDESDLVAVTKVLDLVATSLDAQNP